MTVVCERAKSITQDTTARPASKDARIYPDELTGKSARMPAHFRREDCGLQLRVHVRWETDANSRQVSHVSEHLPSVSLAHQGQGHFSMD